MQKRTNPSTIRDVAKAAGVSVATVSRVLNSPQSVRESTRHQVEVAIRTLNYRPNETARSLSMGRTLSLSVAMPFVARHSFVERLRGAEAAVNLNAYDLVVSNIESLGRRDDHYASLLKGNRFDGAVITTLPPTAEEAVQLAAGPMPVVLLDTSNPLLSSVDCDDIEGGRIAARYLLEKGHRRIVFLGDTVYGFPVLSAAERLIGFREAMDGAGISLQPEDEWWVTHTVRSAKELLPHILARPFRAPPTAIFCTSDMVAFGLLDGLDAMGLKAPDDLAVVGYDDIPLAASYGLTTVHQPLFQSGSSAIELLISLIEEGHHNIKQVVLPLELVVRRSA